MAAHSTTPPTESLSAEIRRAPIDVGLIGIGRNSHIAFNDPPADFDTKDAYLIVTLDEACRNQQVGEGWFATFDDVPKQAISMGIGAIMGAKKVLLAASGEKKADAIYNCVCGAITPHCPATILQLHPNTVIVVDEAAAIKLRANGVAL